MVIGNKNKIRGRQDVDQITVDESAFEDIKEILGDSMKNKCKYCDTLITKDTFGLVFSGITACNNIICLTEAYDEIGEQRKK